MRWHLKHCCCMSLTIFSQLNFILKLSIRDLWRRNFKCFEQVGCVMKIFIRLSLNSLYLHQPWSVAGASHWWILVVRTIGRHVSLCRGSTDISWWNISQQLIDHWPGQNDIRTHFKKLIGKDPELYMHIPYSSWMSFERSSVVIETTLSETILTLIGRAPSL